MKKTLEGFDDVSVAVAGEQEIEVSNALIAVAGGDETKLKALIDANGKVLMQEGIAIEGDGIYDKHNKSYPAGIDAYGTIYADGVDDKDNIMAGKGTVKGIKFNFKYDFKNKKFIDPAEMRKKYSDENIRKIVQDILDGGGEFWAAVVKHVPDALSGDFDDAPELEDAAFVAVKRWIAFNVPGMEG